MAFNIASIQPPDTAIPAAVDWAVGTLLGSVTTGVAVIAVAFLDFGLMFGHLDWRTGVRVVLGMFIVFGAPMIAAELAGLGRGFVTAQSDTSTAQMLPSQPAIPKNAPVADPYAGAGMPQR